MKRDKWYLVANDTLSASTEIEGVRKIKTLSALKGSVVPYEYFGNVPPDRFANLLGRGDIVPYEPKNEEIEILYTCYPAVIPKAAKFKTHVDGIMSYGRAWYRVDESVPYGLAALVDIQGVCKVGDVAFAGDIVPSKFFAGLTMEQFQRLETCGLITDKYIESLAPDVRARQKYHGFVYRYAPDKYELQGLYERFPATNPERKPQAESIVEKDAE
jgi:hypothetical protein